jgi:hypothetical protein
MRRIQSRAQRSLLAGLGFIVIVCSVNMLPNMQFPTLQFYFAAGLAVLMKELPKRAAEERARAKPESEANRFSDPAPEPEYRRAS